MHEQKIKDDWRHSILNVRFSDYPDFYMVPDGMPETIECRRLDMVPGDSLMADGTLIWVPIGFAEYFSKYQKQLAIVGDMVGRLKVDGKTIYARLGICRKDRKDFWEKYLKSHYNFY